MCTADHTGLVTLPYFGFFRSHRNPVSFLGSQRQSVRLNLPWSLVLTAVPLEIPFGTHVCRVAPGILSDQQSCSEFVSLVAPRGCKEACGMSIPVESAR
eukprot:s215_g18.t1